MKHLLLFGLVAAVIVGGYFYLKSTQPKLTSQLENLGVQAVTTAINEVQQVKSVQAPPPLRKTATSPTPAAQQAALTRSGTINWTNQNRAQNDLPALKEDTQLDNIALLRLKDLFAKQYFAHVSPTGEKAETVAKTVGYDFLALGENLALGDFTSDKDLVTAWMNSPGHRANILNTHYDQIGVAVQKGMFEGRMQWIGVQIFGRPASECPAANSGLKASIDANEKELALEKSILDQKRSDLQATSPSDPAYNEKVSDYNTAVNQYNMLLGDTKNLITTYNASVDAYNACIAQ
jgi:uncharacterized protein YkwD